MFSHFSALHRMAGVHAGGTKMISALQYSQILNPLPIDEIYIHIRVGMMEIDQSSFTSVLSVHR